MSRFTKTKAANLTIDATKSKEDVPAPKASPLMDLQGIDLSSFGGDFSANLISLPSLQGPIPTSPTLPQDASSRSFKPALNSRTTSELEQRAELPPPRKLAKDDEEFRPNSSSMSKIYHLRKNPGSTPELSLVGSAESVRKKSDDTNTSQATEVLPQASPSRQEDASSTRRRERTFRNPLSRTKSIRRDSSSSKTKPDTKDLFDRPPKTAPLKSDWQSSSDLLTAKHREKRGKSAERAIASESEDGTPVDRMATRDKFMSGSKNVMNKAKSGGGHLLNKLGKIGRTANHHVPDSEWKPAIITLPLVEQTRVTRISKDLESCRDKTEYWMPSLPWRCIDYLNLNSESEGLYRVPGSGPQVKRWQRRFDTELDVDLLDEKELYDPNTISSLLKSWLREQPTELFPSQTQVSLGAELAKANPDYNKVGQPAPQLLRDALSELPPHNYYLLFAITCHLSLLLGHTDKNKMDLHNLAVCIGPCLRMERWLFNYLVGDWRNCWQGCFTEKHFLAVEKAWEEGRDLDSDSELAGATRSISIPENTLRRHQENLHPEQSLSALPDYANYVGGSLPNPGSGFSKGIVVPEIVQRPATAQGPAAPETSTAAAVTAPPQRPASHSRSHSDVPVSPNPTQPSSLSFPFKVRNG